MTAIESLYTAALKVCKLPIYGYLCYYIFKPIEGRTGMYREIEVKFLKRVLLFAMGLSFLNMVVNTLIHFPMQVNIKWGILFLASAVTLSVVVSSEKRRWVVLGYFVLVITVFLPFGYVDSGGTANNTIGYIFLILLAITYIFRGRQRLFLVLTLIAVFVAVQVVEYRYPELIAVHGAQTQFADRLIQIPLILLTAYLIIVYFAKDYERVNAALYKAAHFDALTGLHNRRAFNEHLETLEESAETRYLVLMDLDNFKSLNDNHGHHVGDAFLVRFSRLLQMHFSVDENLLARWGGDEFAVVFTGDEPELLKRLCAVKAGFEREASTYESGVSVSYGYVCIEPELAMSAVLIQADTLLYAHKRDGSFVSESP